MFIQAKDPLNPKYRATWMIAFNDAYNCVTNLTDILYHDVVGGNDLMRVNTHWQLSDCAKVSVDSVQCFGQVIFGVTANGGSECTKGDFKH